jgi:hypothetical protein
VACRQWITDQFEKVMLYDAGVEAVSLKQQGSNYELTVDISAHQYEADGQRRETEVPLNTWFEIAIFPQSDLPLLEQEPLYKALQNRVGFYDSGCHQALPQLDVKP